MLETPSEKLLELEQMGLRGEYYQAIEELDKILQDKSTRDIDKIQALILKSRFLYMLGYFEWLPENFEQGLELIDRALMLSEKQDRIVQFFDSLVWKVNILWAASKQEESVKEAQRVTDIFERMKKEYPEISKKKEPYYEYTQAFEEMYKALFKEGYVWDFEKSVKDAKKVEKLAKELEDKYILREAYSQLRDIYGTRGYKDKSLEYAEKEHEISVEISNKYFISMSLEQIGFAYWRKGEFDLLLEYAKKALEIREKQGNERGAANSYASIAVYHGEIGEWKKCLEYTQKAYNILSEMGKREEGKGWLVNIGVCYYFLGEFDEALKNYQECYEYQKEKGYFGQYNCLGNIAYTYISKGEFDRALKINEELLDFYSRAGVRGGIVGCYLKEAEIYKRKGLFKKTLEYLEKALTLQIEGKNKIDIAGTYYEIILVAVKMENHDLAKEYFEKLEKITEDIEYKSIRRLVMVAEGIILKNSSEVRDRIRAEVLFEQLLQEEIGSYLQIEILLQLSELLLVELKETSDKKYLNKLEKSISKLIEIGTKNHLPAVIIECLWFKSQLAMLELDVDKARELLTQALNTAESKGYNILALKITNSKEQIIKQTMALEEIGKDKAPIAKRMEIIRVENGFKEMKEKEAFEFKIEKVESSRSLLSIKI